MCKNKKKKSQKFDSLVFQSVADEYKAIHSECRNVLTLSHSIYGTAATHFTVGCMYPDKKKKKEKKSTMKYAKVQLKLM